MKVALLIVVGVGMGLAQESGQTTVWKGVYSAAQAARGETAYANYCSSCHRADLTGYDGLLVGQRFMEHWREDSVRSFYRLMKMSMPRGAPDSLGDPAYLDIMAFVLQSNGFPEGQSELKLAALDRIQIEGKDGPKPVPEFALVKTVGCLVLNGKGEWMLERASEPRRTRDPRDSSPEELKAAASLIGKDVVHFLNLPNYDVERFHMEAEKGYKVEAKGLLILKDGGKILNLTSVAPVSPGCP
jgi:hypothetical protein